MKFGNYLDRIRYSTLGSLSGLLDKKGTLSPFNKFEEILSLLRVSETKTQEPKSVGLRISEDLARTLPYKYEGAVGDLFSSPETEAKPTGSSMSHFFLSRYRALSSALSTENNQRRGFFQISGDFDKNFSKKKIDSPIRQKIDLSVKKAAIRYRLPINLIQGVIKAESDFQVRAVSSAGAIGLMQLMPGTAKELGIKHPFDIDQNIDGGSRYLREMLDRFGSDTKLALAAYNAGPDKVEKYQGIPPYRETKQYVNRVLKYMGQMA